MRLRDDAARSIGMTPPPPSLDDVPMVINCFFVSIFSLNYLISNRNPRECWPSKILMAHIMPPLSQTISPL